MGDDYPIVTEEGSDVIRVRAAITNVVPGNPALVGATLVGPGAMLSLGKKLTTGSSIGVGEAGIEAELLDSRTGEQLVVYIDHKMGSKYKVTDSISNWGHVKFSLEGWAKKFRTRLEETHAE